MRWVGGGSGQRRGRGGRCQGEFASAGLVAFVAAPGEQEGERRDRTEGRDRGQRLGEAGAGLTQALTAIPAFGAVAALAFLLAGRSYEGDKARAGELALAPAAATPALA